MLLTRGASAVGQRAKSPTAKANGGNSQSVDDNRRAVGLKRAEAVDKRLPASEIRTKEVAAHVRGKESRGGEKESERESVPVPFLSSYFEGSSRVRMLVCVHVCVCVRATVVRNFSRRDHRFSPAILRARRMQEVNWNGRKTCVAVTVQTYRLSLARPSLRSLLSLSLSLGLYPRFTTSASCTHACTYPTRIAFNARRADGLVTGLENREKPWEDRAPSSKNRGDCGRIFRLLRRDRSVRRIISSPILRSL